MNAVESRVSLIQHTPDPEGLIAAAARLCYAEDASDLTAGSAEKSRRMVAMLQRVGHLSPLEHASFTFLVEGVSRAMTHQLVRHRLASYSQRSQRYVRHAEFDYVQPPALEGKTVQVDGRSIPAPEYFRETMDLLAERYRRLNEALGNTGETSNQDARYVLPNACETKIAVTMNARELLHFFAERLCRRAQWEIRGVAEQMLALVRALCPGVFAGAGPKCVQMGRCPEGSKTCGQYEPGRALDGQAGPEGAGA